MKAIRKIIDANKEYFSLCLLLVFLTASTARNIVSVFEGIDTIEADYTKKGQYLISADDEDSALGTLSLKDSDADDIELIYYGNYTAQKQLSIPVSGHDFFQESEYLSTYNIPLYDLYCNWKFHLS